MLEIRNAADQCRLRRFIRLFTLMNRDALGFANR